MPFTHAVRPFPPPLLSASRRRLMVHTSTGVFCPHRSPASMTFVAPADPYIRIPSFLKIRLSLISRMSPPVYRRYTHPWQTKGPLPHPCTLPNFKLGINDLPRHVLPPLHKPGAATPSLLFGVCTHLFFTAPIRSNVSLRIDTPLPPRHPRPCLHDARPVKRRSSLPSPHHTLLPSSRLPIPLPY